MTHPSLADVPFEYILDQLHSLAPRYWDNPDSADCTIIVPVPHARGRPPLSSDVPSLASMYDSSGQARRVSQPSENFLPRISLKLHVDYLSAHSSYLRGLFSGASALDLISSTSAPSYAGSASSPFPIPADRLPRLLSSSPNHPVLFLPVPDPTSLHLLVHWMYFGQTNYIQDALHQGIIQWEGIARNVEYLGLPADIKVFLGRWYSNWLHPDRDLSADEFDDDSDTAYSDNALDPDDSSTASDDMDDAMSDSDDDEKECCRGRTRATRPLSLSSVPDHRLCGSD